LRKKLVRQNNLEVTIDNIRATHKARRREILSRLAEFQEIWKNASDKRLFEELVFCIFTAGASARMGLRSIEAIKELLPKGKQKEIEEALVGVHRYPAARADYIIATRTFLHADCRLRLRKRLESFEDAIERRDWLAREKRIKGLGYKESSHFLRNIGLRGYAILDKHILRSMAELGVIKSPQPPTTGTKYLETEERLKSFAREVKIDFDELDLVLWSMKTGEVLK
jgi:N-glycosylase/DNA lyase